MLNKFVSFIIVISVFAKGKFKLLFGKIYIISKAFDFMSWKIFFSFVFFIIAVSLLVIYWFFPFGTIEFYKAPSSENFNFTLNSSEDAKMQFYDNMRYPEKKISYNIGGCPLQKEYDMKQAFEIISNLTVMEFYPVETGGEILVACEDTNRVENGLFVAGEGGPVNITKTSNFNVILNGEILLIRDSKCERPNVEIHELFHALGFDHSQNPQSVMYNLTKCSQEIGSDLIERVDYLYSFPEYPDLAVENASALMHGKYLDANVTIRNEGLKDSEKGKLIVYADDVNVKEYEISEIKIGYGTEIFLGNLWVPQTGVNELRFFLEYPHPELEKNNNEIKLEIKK